MWEIPDPDQSKAIFFLKGHKTNWVNKSRDDEQRKSEAACLSNFSLTLTFLGRDTFTGF